MEDFQALVSHYAQAGLYRHIQKLCQASAHDPKVQFWNAFAIAQEGNYAEALRQLAPVRHTPELGLASVAALINTHKQCKVQDKDALDKLKDELKLASKNATDDALVFASVYFWHAGKAKQARQCVEKVLSKDRKRVDGLCHFGWLNLTSGNSRYERKAPSLFETALKLSGNKCLSAVLGRARYNERRQRYHKVVDDLNSVVVNWPSFEPALTEKARALMALGQWDEAVAAVERALDARPADVVALQLSVLALLARETRTPALFARITELRRACEAAEPRNALVFFQTSQLIARLANRWPQLLQQSMLFIEKACSLQPHNAVFLTEKAHQLMLLGELDRALKYFGDASKLDESNVSALHGRIKCKIMGGELKEAAQELEFLKEIESSLGENAELMFLQALLAWEKDRNEERCLVLLTQAVTTHLRRADEAGGDSAADGAGFQQRYVSFNPDFVLGVVTQLMGFVGTEPRLREDPPNPLLRQAVQLLTRLLTMVPGMLQAQLLLARTYYLDAQFERARRAADACLRLDPQCAPAHVLLAQLCLQEKNYKDTAAHLQHARSFDLQVFSTPLFCLLRAQLAGATGRWTEALQLLEASMSMPGVAKSAPAGSSSSAAAAAPVLPVQERIALYLELFRVQLRLKRTAEAAKTLAHAKAEFASTAERVRVTLAESDALLAKGEVEGALKLLRSVPSSSVYHTRAQIKQAGIFLRFRKDKKGYVACFRGLVEASGGKDVHSLVLLGEAYMRIQEPERAIKAYQDAFKLEPDDPELSSRIGRAFITTHDYQKAVEYYENATRRDPSKRHLFHELAALYLDLRKFPEAVRVLEEALRPRAEGEGKQPAAAAAGGDEKADAPAAAAGAADQDLWTMATDVKSRMLLSEVYKGARQPDLVKRALTDAWNLQSVVVGKLQNASFDEKRKQHLITADICNSIAEYYASHRQADKAVKFYSEALKHNEQQQESRVALAKLHLLAGSLEECRTQCQVLLSQDPSNKEASLLLADVMFRKNEHDEATRNFQDLLHNNPAEFESLAKLVQLLRRAGKLNLAPAFISRAEKVSGKFSPPGLHFSKGLLAWYSQNAHEALQEFNCCRKDGVWGRRALHCMVEVYLNPDNSPAFVQEVEAKGDSAAHVSAAKELLKELDALLQGEDDHETAQVRVLHAYTWLASKDKAQIDRAVASMVQLAQERKDFVPALLCLANAYALIHQPAKQRNQLKVISRMPFNADYSREFERAWLMLADMYIKTQKYDMAQQLCRKCLKTNKSSARAWEHLGLICMEEGAWKDAADKYEHAWRHMHEASPAVGFKLALTYLKAERYVEAIRVCHRVLEKNPQYPKIRKEILAKARNCLRP